MRISDWSSDVCSSDLRVIHAELPHDAETLQHRSGRTGRAGRKGICILLVPYPKRRRAEGMLRAARVNAQWVAPPSIDEIRARDQERLLESVSQTGDAAEEDQIGRASGRESVCQYG